ncbi:hypothetical protein V2J09_010633 [Rumex salicifolius]
MYCIYAIAHSRASTCPKRILRLWHFLQEKQRGCEVGGFTYSDYAKDIEDGKSTGEYVFFLAGGAASGYPLH